MGEFADKAFSVQALQRAWEQVAHKDAADGSVSYGVQRFAARSPERLPILQERLLSGSYRPGSLRACRVRIGTKRRQLHIPTIEDRIVARAVLDTVSHVVDPVLGHSSYAYRAGLGVTDAVQAVVDLREEGLNWVLRSDVEDCFPTLPVGLAIERFAACVPDAAVVSVVEAMARRRVRGGARLTGFPQGCALSPLLANLVLTDLDQALFAHGHPIVRYADDFVVAGSSREAMVDALAIASQALKGLGMSVAEDKTEIMDFAVGFAFLGEEFGPRYPADTSKLRVADSEDKVVYAGVPGGRARLNRGRVVVESADEVPMLDVPSSHVARIVVFGATGLSAGLRTWALRNGIDVVMGSRTGSYLGVLSGDHAASNGQRLVAQASLMGTERALEISREIVRAKILKQIVVLQRFGRTNHAADVQTASADMRGLVEQAATASSTTDLMGLEGAAARSYFSVYGTLFPDDVRFGGRSRQPPLDVPNAAMSYLYTVLLGECITALRAAGLDPSLGLLHSPQERRPSLALDLMEEFRPLVVDQVVLHAARRGTLTAADGRTEEGRAGVLLQREALQRVLVAYETRMLTQTSGALPDVSGTLRRHIYWQAQRLRAVIMSPDEQWRGMSWR